MKITMQHKMWAWHTWSHVAFIIGLSAIIVNGQWGYLIPAFILAFMSQVFVSISLHRYLAHKSFKTGNLRDVFLRYITIWTGLGPSIMWVMAHRHHHAYADTPEDFQNPRIIGAMRSWFTVYPKFKLSPRWGKDLYSNHHNKFIYNNYFKIQFIAYILLFAINPYLCFIVLAAPAVACFHGAASIGVLTHLWGYRVHNSKDTSTNNILANILMPGEGWHNHHHARPGDYRFGHGKFEWDPPAWIIEKFFKIKHD